MSKSACMRFCSILSKVGPAILVGLTRLAVIFSRKRDRTVPETGPSGWELVPFEFRVDWFLKTRERPDAPASKSDHQDSP